MKRSTFFMIQGLVFVAIGLAWRDALLPFACLANFSFGRWAEITK
jgi:hypothetical protein